MTVPLISTSQLAFMRTTVERAFNTDVDIYKRSLVESVYEDEATETFTFSETIKGWVYSTPSSSAAEVGFTIGTLNLYRLFVPVGSDVEPGDRLKIDGNDFLVIDTINESTWLPLLRCSLRRLE
jgi:hypothetical protein